MNINRADALALLAKQQANLGIKQPPTVASTPTRRRFGRGVRREVGQMNKTEADLVIEVPIRTHNPLNGSHQHWSVKARRRKQERNTVTCHMLGLRLPPLPVALTLTRIGKRKMDTDGLAASFKAVRDAIAERYGVDDGDARYEWVYRQEIGKGYAVRIEVVKTTMK